MARLSSAASGLVWSAGRLMCTVNRRSWYIACPLQAEVDEQSSRSTTQACVNNCLGWLSGMRGAGGTLPPSHERRCPSRGPHRHSPPLFRDDLRSRVLAAGARLVTCSKLDEPGRPLRAPQQLSDPPYSHSAHAQLFMAAGAAGPGRSAPAAVAGARHPSARAPAPPAAPEQTAMPSCGAGDSSGVYQ